ncbi:MULTISPECIES: NADH:ubiquinone reductase (Na(+)-transporting) subunit D [unclassified Arsukibacterium]|uniref:NADH:ubiquinone reductase (Na(+)-transporting) subunit D n=1 Tax=unclassified Arsukibacterium TaxID=2635278 RepID=UPI000C6814C4|nr:MULTISPECIES: NADH:ubiquinone reductase (Na(+)-transporting) subunit D [unclassified Arsukibacterium]MAA95436.1 NADH:ubiquinone reductase (Na(+)-transporting) subunit D [Rheinheimera sp.]MAD74209.1 NADH:ubiquinone reductase (Na(+)-transporting) subunit D [Rheinheimera sp.]MBM33560.1 NADH:ubiquinone reductase (Na(+)-transporting) subunit D [Rheinheimera sp.]HAW92860.1 NADH:ubiquinone reductase (Na(+)-transporting) subunit D [Candidatus Azambacteria bacterium]|tara:strand:+ start:116143 stop:116772 length:630 start_codon:yes stop_codon:yes gene_type:complete
MANAKEIKTVLFGPIFANNPIALQVLGICSALAVTTKMDKALVMCIALTFVTAFSNLFISTIRNHIPSSVRIIVQMTIIASLVIVVDQFLKAYAYDVAKELSVFVGLIITNCIVMGRAEAYAMKSSPGMSFLDGIGNGLGYSVVLMVVAFIRELGGSGSVFGVQIMPLISEGGWYQPIGLLLMPPSAFIIIACFIWILRTYRPEQIEKA